MREGYGTCSVITRAQYVQGLPGWNEPRDFTLQSRSRYISRELVHITSDVVLAGFYIVALC